MSFGATKLHAFSLNLLFSILWSELLPARIRRFLKYSSSTYICSSCILWSLDLDLPRDRRPQRRPPRSEVSPEFSTFDGDIGVLWILSLHGDPEPFFQRRRRVQLRGGLGWRTLTLNGKDHEKLEVVGRKHRNRSEGPEIFCDTTPQWIYKFQEVFVRFMIFTHSQSESMICYIFSSPQLGGPQNLFQILPIQVNISKNCCLHPRPTFSKWPQNRISITCLSLFIFISYHRILTQKSNRPCA